METASCILLDSKLQVHKVLKPETSGMSWIPRVFANMKHDASSVNVDPRLIAEAIKNHDLKATMELLKQVFKGSNRGSHVCGLYGDGVFVGKITNDLITRGSWVIATAGSATGMYLALTSTEKAKLQSQLDQKQAENDALIQTNSELVRTNSELVASNNELTIANNELAKANKKCQTEVGTCNSNFAHLIGRK